VETIITAQSTVAPRTKVRALPITLWGVQGLLAAFFVYAGATKLFLPAEQLAEIIPWTGEYKALVAVAGLADLAGGLGILLPSLTRIQPRLTVLAALGLIVLQVLAFAFHASRGELGALPVNTVLIALCAFVLWGRGKILPIAPRA
jgi:uncharacterized membrane protein